MPKAGGGEEDRRLRILLAFGIWVLLVLSENLGVLG